MYSIKDTSMNLDLLQQKFKTLQKRTHSPKTDLMISDSQVIVRMELPVKEFSWELTNDDTVLIVSLNKGTPLENVQVVYQETRYGSCKRRVKLPNKVQSKPKSETWENGIWTIHFDKEHIEAKDWADST